MRSSRLALLLALCLVGGAPAARAKVYFSRSEALELAFPEADRIERENLVLSDEQLEAIQSKARARVDSKLVTVYKGVGQGRVLGYAFIDIHTVRTLPEAFLVVLSPEGRVRTLRVLAFYEPEEYRPAERWLQQFEHTEAGGLEAVLRVGGGIHGIAGSTLSARAVTGGVRRALAMFEVLVRPGLAPGAATAAAPETRGPPAASVGPGGIGR